MEETAGESVQSPDRGYRNGQIKRLFMDRLKASYGTQTLKGSSHPRLAVSAQDEDGPAAGREVLAENFVAGIFDQVLEACHAVILVSDLPLMGLPTVIIRPREGGEKAELLE